MITVYTNGQDFIRENDEFLRTNEHLSLFFRLDAPLLRKSNRENYAIKCTAQNDTLLALKVEPYNLLLFGSSACTDELTSYLMTNNYEIKNYLSETNVGDKLMEILKKDYSISYVKALWMNFMTATEITDPSDDRVIPATPDDLDEILECLGYFISDCGLLDTIDKNNIIKTLSYFRLIKESGKIVSMAKFVPSYNSAKIVDVYTRDEYRGKGYARKVVATLKNEIISSGKIATLNVDVNNPVSSHLYESLGFSPLFSQAEYRPFPKK